MTEHVFKEIINEIKSVKKPKTTFEFQDYYNHVQYLPDNKAKELRKAMINHDKNIFYYPGELKKIVYDICPKEKTESTLPINSAMYIKGGNKRIIDFDKCCLNCTVEFTKENRGKDYYCMGCEKMAEKSAEENKKNIPDEWHKKLTAEDKIFINKIENKYNVGVN